MVVVINYGSRSKKFGSEANARDYFDSLVAKGQSCWLISKETALRLGLI